MPRLTRIYPYPAQGRADRPSDDDPVADVAIRGCRSVAELYSDALAALDLPFRDSELRVFTHHDAARDGVHGTIQLDPLGGGLAMAHLAVPTAFVERSAAVRAHMLLDAVHGIVVRLAAAPGWDVGALDDCRRHVLDHDLTYRWTSAPKTSPDRRLLAYADFRLAADGYGRARIRLVRRDDRTTVAISDEALAFSTRAATLHLDRQRRDGGDWRPEGEAQGTSAHGAAAPEQPPEISFVGGGPLQGADVVAFHEVFSSEMRRLTSPAGQTWWADADVRLCDISILYECKKAGVRGRRTGNVLRIYVDQPAPDLLGVDTARAARDVARQVVALVRRRTCLGPHPELADA